MRQSFSHWLLTSLWSLSLLSVPGVVSSATHPVAPKAPTILTIGVVDTNEPGWRAETLNPTIAYLEQQLPGVRLQIRELSSYQTADDVRRLHPDLIVAPSDVFLTLINLYGAQALAVRKTNYAKDPVHSVGSTVVVPITDTTTESLEDLRGKRIAASLPDSLGGWLALEGEIHTAGWDEKHFFGAVDFLSFQIPDVINDVLSGKSDAGVLSACQLEMAESTGLIEKGMLRVVNQKPGDGLACLHSTRLYPDLVFGALNFANPEVLKNVSIALLMMEQEPTFSWQLAGKFDEVASLYRTLQIGPFAPQKWTVSRIFLQFWKEIAAALLLIIFLVANEVRLNWLVKRRTQALNDTLKEKEALAERETQMRNRLATMERHAIAAQMSSMIAHELKQPLTSILNYSAVQKMQLDALGIEDDRIEHANDRIEHEAQRIADIVDRVRGYVKKTNLTQKVCALDDIVKKALISFQHYADYSSQITVTALAHESWVLGNELELEILVLNLLKNAARAIKPLSDGAIQVSVTETSATQWTLEVLDNGPRLTEEMFQRLKVASDSMEGGLGLGLGIVRSIVDAHSADLAIEQRDPRGIAMRVVFDKASNDATSDTNAKD